MPIAHQLDYLGRGRAQQLEQYKGLPRMDALLQSYLREVQAVEDALWTVYVDRILPMAAAVFPVVISISTTGVLGTMAFTYTIAGGAKQGPVTSTATTFAWNVPGTPFFVAFSAMNYTSTAWTYTIVATGTITAAGGAGGTDISLPFSDLLAKLGKLVGQTNNYGLTDPQYLNLITARIRVNRSNGLRGDLIDITALLVPAAKGAVYVKDFGPASVYVYPMGPVPLSAYIIAQSFVGLAVDAGVALLFVWTAVAVASTRTFGSVYASGFSQAGNVFAGDGTIAGQQFGSAYHAAFSQAGNIFSSTGGGVYAGAIGVTGGRAP